MFLTVGPVIIFQGRNHCANSL